LLYRRAVRRGIRHLALVSIAHWPLLYPGGYRRCQPSRLLTSDCIVLRQAVQVGGAGAIIYLTRQRAGDTSTVALADDWKGPACSFLPSRRTTPGPAADHLRLPLG